jgi:hypothetical protein
MIRKSRYPDRNRNRTKALVVVTRVEASYLGSKSIGPHDSILQRRVCQDNRELFATMSAADIAGAKKRA